MEKGKKNKIINVGLWCGLVVLVLFVIVTACLVKNRQDRLNDLASSNQQIEDKLEKNDVAEVDLNIF